MTSFETRLGRRRLLVGLLNLRLVAGEVAAALRAAGEMQQRVGDMNALRAAKGKPQFEIGIGVHTGWVIFGAVGSARRQDFSVLGQTVNLAARLCEAATPGQILASEIALNAAHGGFVAEPVDADTLPGRAAGVRPFAVKEEKPKGG